MLKLALWVQTIPLNPCNMLLIMKVNNVVVHVTFTYSAVTFFFQCVETLFDSSLPPIVCGRAHVLFKFFVCACA